ncbi:type VII secretion integral membrane protein EccD [Micromonospora sp. WMMD961]|uniref:type VII secretion integral membrane protein EccD n=1 Tax=Micromonospora sp. WMMD961 TaxID=3016100 RepID=UPI002416798C|nr:type VII secretion integral membrane protein EccD [Micromonospora sp. WMMD961]MDG4778153.1 type VII secretion integral membrane protein EccD [Micromonospora sp. WMMD961]
MTQTQPSTAAGQLSRVTLAGAGRQIDLVLPADEPLGLMLPEIVAMVGHQPMDDSRGYQISTLDGTVLDPAGSLRQAAVSDGAMLRVDPISEAPPAAIVHDVADELGDDLARRQGRWGTTPRMWTATAVCLVAAGMAAVLAAPRLGPVAVSVIGGVVALAGLLVGLVGRRAVGIAVLLSGAATTMSMVPGLASGSTLRWALWAIGAGCIVLAVGAVTGNRRAGVLGGGTLLILVAGWGVPLAFAVPAERVAAVLSIVSVGLLGLLPRLAMIASGLTRLDDRRSNDEAVSRVAVLAAVDSAHRGLAVATLATTASASLGGLVLAAAAGPWALVLAALVATALLLRMRAFPLTVEVAGLVAGALVIAGGLLARWARDAPGVWWGPALVALAFCAVTLVILAYRPPPHALARARQYADRVEALTVMALVPVAVGVFGLYSRLLNTF